MKTLFDINNLETLPKEQLLCECYHCGASFQADKTTIKRVLGIIANPSGSTLKFCSQACRGHNRNIRIEAPCTNCGTIVSRPPKDFKRVKNIFCKQSCAATYNNLHKITGTRRSKLEIWLEEKLSILYPDLEILYCDKTTINSELDIYIPSIRLAFELNGIYHYEPIHGQNKLDQVQNNDKRKFIACLDHNIELAILDVSKLKYFKEHNCQVYLDIIIKLINNKLLGE
jgi:hypothetical protein